MLRALLALGIHSVEGVEIFGHAGVKKFLISFDDGDEIWTGLPAKDVRPVMPDLATPGGIAREGLPGQVG